MESAASLTLMVTMAVVLLILWPELELLMAEQAPLWFLGGVLVLTLGGAGVWAAAQGRDEAALRRSSLAVAIALMLLAAYQWPEVQQARYLNLAVDTEIRLENARAQPTSREARLLELERDARVADILHRYEWALTEVRAHDYRYAKGSVALILSLLWLSVAVWSGPVIRAIRK